MSNRLTNLIAGLLLLTVFLVCFFSMKDDSATMDEMSHIPAGYSYLTQKDFRINPEHPPLIKDLAAVPLLSLDLNFPKNHASWTEGINEQWWFGSQFLYRSGNNPDQIVFWARIPMILLLIFLGWFLFRWARELAGNKVALLVLTLFSFSPTFLAHGRLVTTDIAAALGVVLATYFWLKFLKSPTKKNIILAGLIFGLSMLLKFSLALLVPFFAVITVIYAWSQEKGSKKCLLGILKYIGLALIVGIIGMILIWPVYQFHLLNYPAERQLQDSEFILASSGINPLKNLCLWMADKPVLRPYAYYLLGLLMVTQRVAGGNTVYFLNEISNGGWWYYFPTVYLLKIPLAFHILTLIVLLYAAWLIIIKKPFWQNTFHRLKDWIKNHFPEFSMMVFLIIYWLTSITGTLNIGVRHLLPVFPFTYILVSLGIAKWIKRIPGISRKKMGTSLVSVLLGFYIISSLLVWPHYLTYFNEIAGGPQNGYKYVVDSNYDWGQDLKRLKKWVDENKIEKIYVDYFGGGDTEYYLKEKYASWWGDRNKKELPQGSYLAVSATLLQGGKGSPTHGFDQPTGYYRWLDDYQPITRVGNSIFIYYIP
ncbi:glycosyltransferase family 39 protein [Patescibacteria group bacterium]|nr:glycosyltransferase family 39 protein [Patescibacteria group bacterium]